MTPPGAKSTRFMESPRVFRPGKLRTFAEVKLELKILFVLPSFESTVEKKSSATTLEVGLQRNPLTVMSLARRLATQKSWRGSGSEWQGEKKKKTAKQRRRRSCFAMVWVSMDCWRFGETKG